MTHLKDEITRNDLKRKWPRLRIIPQFPHHVALPAEKVRDRVNREVIFCAAGVLDSHGDPDNTPTKRVVQDVGSLANRILDNRLPAVEATKIEVRNSSYSSLDS
jgi:hypothetical protein